MSISLWEEECRKSKTIVQIMESQGIDMIVGVEGSPEFIESNKRWCQIRDSARILEVDTKEIIDTMNYMSSKK